MCVIVDANMASSFFAKEPELLPLWEWINGGKAVLVYGGKLTDELLKVERAARQIKTWRDAGLAHRVARDEIRSEERGIKAQCSSDDPHVIALARVSGARLLCSSDKTLHADFKSTLISNPSGAIYQNASHTSLLRHRQGCRFKAPGQ